MAVNPVGGVGGLPGTVAGIGLYVLDLLPLGRNRRPPELWNPEQGFGIPTPLGQGIAPAPPVAPAPPTFAPSPPAPAPAPAPPTAPPPTVPPPADPTPAPQRPPFGFPDENPDAGAALARFLQAILRVWRRGAGLLFEPGEIGDATLRRSGPIQRRAIPQFPDVTVQPERRTRTRPAPRAPVLDPIRVPLPDLTDVPLPNIPSPEAPPSTRTATPPARAPAPTAPRMPAPFVPLPIPRTPARPGVRPPPSFSPLPPGIAPAPPPPQLRLPPAPTLPDVGLTPSLDPSLSFNPLGPTARPPTRECECAPERKPKRKKGCTNPVLSRRKYTRKKDGKLVTTVTREVICQSSSASSLSRQALRSIT